MVFIYEVLDTMQDVRAKIQECEGSHVQQVCYSTYMDTLTQICFTEQKIRSTVEWEGSKSWNKQP